MGIKSTEKKMEGQLLQDDNDVKFNLKIFLKKIPKHLIQGPWHIFAHIILSIFFGYLLMTYQH